MNYHDVDMDELEARLYGQVHHMPEYSEGVTYPEVQNTQAKTFTRYFDGASPTPLNNLNRLRSTPTPNYDRMGVYSIPVAPINNIVVVQPPPTQTITQRPNSQKWLEQLLQKYENARSKTKRKFRKLKDKVRERKLQNAKFRPTSVGLSENCPAVKSDNICVISDDSSHCSDDVIIIENKPEVIDIDCEIEQRTPSANETKEHIPSSKKTKQIPSPTLTDSLSLCHSSTSNDFLDNTTVSKGETSPLPASKTIYETVSNCSSTIDYCENLKKTQEDFSIPSSSTFPELNLDGFTNYIASNGKRSADLETLTWLPPAKRPKYQQKKSLDTSDSSSESDDENSACSLKDEELEEGESKNVTENVNTSETVEDQIDTPVEKDDNPLIYVDDDVEMWKTPVVDDVVSEEPERFSKYWTEDMNKFYKESWGQENFSVIEQQRKMSDDPNMWKVSVKDRLYANRKSWEPRCRRCLEFGHIALKCTKNLEPIKCCLCGGKGHAEDRCPDTVCTTCRRKSPYYTTFCGGCVNKRQLICPICNMTGHNDSDCPDLWRRYLFTTKDGEVQQPAGINMKLLEDRWCSGCGMNGHFEQNCHYYNRSHAPTSVFIHSFQNVYGSSELPPDCENVSSADNLSENLNEQQTETAEHTKENTDELNREDVWYIEQSQYKYLVGGEAKNFLSLLQRKTSVTIQVERTSTVRLLFSGGTAEDLSNIKAAISRYITAKETSTLSFDVQLALVTKKPLINALQINLNRLYSKKVDWLGTAHLIYKRIQMLTESIARCTKAKTYRKHQQTLKVFYRRLNTIIISKLKIGSDKTHMDTLEKCLQTNQVLLYSFEYVFNSCHVLYPNYEELIAQLPHVPNKFPHDMQVIVFENMKSSMVNICSKWKLPAWSKRIVHLYNDLVISNYSKRQTQMFKSTCSKISEVVETLRKKNPV